MSNNNLLEKAEAIIGKPIQNQDLFLEALTHASIASDRLSSNERLEFLGDSVLGLVICNHLFHTHTSWQEGDLTKVKSAVVSRRACALVSDDIGLTDLLQLGKGMTTRGQLPSSLRAAVVESFIGAIYIDHGMETAESFILRAFESIIEESANSQNQGNFKSQLQQYAQRELGGTPQYDTLDEQGPDHSKCFEVCVTINGQSYPSAWGPNKKDAEQKAALNALVDLEIIDPQEIEDEHYDDELDEEGLYE